MRTGYCLLAGLFVLALTAAQTTAVASEVDTNKYTLRYRFHPGETIRWEVAHKARTRTTVSGITKIVETVSKSIKVWRVTEVKPDGSATFEHLVESVDMRQKFGGSEEVRYNSRTDQKPPPEFQHVAESVGLVLASVTMDARGNIVHRKRNKVKAGAQNDGEMTIPMPDESIAVGHTWSFPHEIEVKLNTGAIKKVKARQTFTLQSVKTGVARIRVTTQILTPIDNPALESQLIQRESSGIVRFDIDAGRVLDQGMEVDKHVVGFSGPTSSLHYCTCFTEKLLPSANIAARPGEKRQ